MFVLIVVLRALPINVVYLSYRNCRLSCIWILYECEFRGSHSGVSRVEVALCRWVNSLLVTEGRSDFMIE